MKNSLLVSILTIFIGGFFASALQADNTLARFKGGIGVHPVSNVAGTANADGSFPNVNRNIVRGVNPAGQFGVIEDLDARVKTNGDIAVGGKVLILAGGNNAERASGQSVFATLICETAAQFVEHITLSAPANALELTASYESEEEQPAIPFRRGQRTRTKDLHIFSASALNHSQIPTHLSAFWKFSKGAIPQSCGSLNNSGLKSRASTQLLIREGLKLLESRAALELLERGVKSP